MKVNIIILLSVLYLLKIEIYAENISDNEKKEHLNIVAKQIWSAVSQPARFPEIIVYDEKIKHKRDIVNAWYNPRKNVINFGSNMYDLCMEYGEEALATVLSHEMGHYFYNHNLQYSSAGFVLTDVDSEIVTDFNADIAEQLELQADIFSTFKCYSAGYDISDAMPQIIEKIYQYNKLPENIKGYISKEDRKKVSSQALKVFVNLIPLYDAATYLFLLGQFETAGEIFGYVAEKGYTSWEVYSNAGLCYALAAYANMPEETQKYRFPFQLQDNSKLLKYEDIAGNKVRGSSDSKEIKYLLSQAELNLMKAISQNPEAFVNHLNLSGVLVLNEKYAEANSYAEEAKRLSETNEENALSYTAKGLVMAIEGKNDIAMNEFENALKYSKLSITEYNKCIALKQNCNNAVKNIKPKENINLNEKICGLSRNDLPFAEINWDKISNYPKLDNMTVSFAKNNECTKIKIEQNNTFAVIVETNSEYTGKTGRGLAIGSTKDEVITHYGHPSVIRETNSGEYLIYSESGIAFLIKDNKISKWLIYMI